MIVKTIGVVANLISIYDTFKKNNRKPDKTKSAIADCIISLDIFKTTHHDAQQLREQCSSYILETIMPDNINAAQFRRKMITLSEKFYPFCDLVNKYLNDNSLKETEIEISAPYFRVYTKDLIMICSSVSEICKNSKLIQEHARHAVDFSSQWVETNYQPDNDIRQFKFFLEVARHPARAILMASDYAILGVINILKAFSMELL